MGQAAAQQQDSMPKPLLGLVTTVPLFAGSRRNANTSLAVQAISPLAQRLRTFVSAISVMHRKSDAVPASRPSATLP